MLAAFEAACCAAKGVPLRDPRKPSDPELFHDRTLPFMSEMVTIVLLKDACTYASPCGTCLRSFFLKVFFLPFLSGAAAAPPAAAGFAMKTVLGRQSLVVGRWQTAKPDPSTLEIESGRFRRSLSGFGRRPTTNDQRRFLCFCC